MTLVKIAPSKSYARKQIFLGLQQTFNCEMSCLAKKILFTLVTKVLCTFLKSVWNKIFLPHSPTQRKRKRLEETSVADPWNFGVNPDPQIHASD